MDFTPSLRAKQFYRFTGPPEHWLTAVKFMTWGLEKKYGKRWQGIQTGDIFFIHSTGSGKSRFKNAKSGIIGIGVVGSNFSIKENLLWLREQEDKANTWPLLIPLSEVYLFGELPSPEKWQSPDLNNSTDTERLIDLLLKNRTPISNINGFPQMGSFSAVSDNVAEQILYDKKPLYIYESDDDSTTSPERLTELVPIKSAEESLRYADTLKLFDNVKARIVKKSKVSYTKDNELLARAEDAHTTVLQNLINMFKEKGYETRYNKHVDLFAHNDERTFLIEVKSIENKNFRPQARKGIVQLLECEYFDVKKFLTDEKLSFNEYYKSLIFSKEPQDSKYIELINELKIGVGSVIENSINPVGVDLGFSRI